MDSIIANLSIDDNLYLQPILTDLEFPNTNIISIEYLNLIEKNKSKFNDKNNFKFNFQLDEIIKNIQTYYKFNYKPSEIKIFKIKDIYDVESITNLNNLIIKFEKSFIVKIPDRYSHFYLINFGSREIKINSQLKIYNNIENMRNFIYLILSELK